MVHTEYLAQFKYKYYRVHFIQDGKELEVKSRQDAGELELFFTKRLKFKGHRPHQTGFTDYDEWFGLFTHQTLDGDLNFGYIHYVPGGYSSVTYEPEITFNVYVGYSWTKFLRLGLPSDFREIIEKRKLIKSRLKK